MATRGLPTKRLSDALKRTKYFVEWFMTRRCGLLVNVDGTQQAPVVFEVRDWKEIYELAAYGGFPRRYEHYRFGMGYDELIKGHTYGLQKIYEMVINNDPVFAYLLESNGLVDQKLVMAHVYAHADFFWNNAYFAGTNRKAVDMMANHAVAIEMIKDRMQNSNKEQLVEEWIDTCLSLADLIDRNASAIQRSSQKEDADFLAGEKKEEEVWSGKFDAKNYLDEFVNPKDEIARHRLRVEAERKKRADIEEKGLIFPAEPTPDVFKFLIDNAPIEKWQRDIALMLWEEAYYFLPQGQTKICNEGWAAYWHSWSMTNGLLNDAEVIDYADHDSGTCARSQGRLNPYDVGREIFRDIVRRWDAHRHGKIYTECDDRIVCDFWEQFTAFKNIYEENKNDPQRFSERWREFLCFWGAIKDGAFSFPKEIYSPDLLLRWWSLYGDCDTQIASLKAELVNYRKQVVEIKKKINLYKEDPNRLEKLLAKKDFLILYIRQCRVVLNFFETFAKIREAFRLGNLRPEPFDIPQNFYDYADKFSGLKLPIGSGLEKIFEVRRVHCDLTLIEEFLTEELAHQLELFQYDLDEELGEYIISSRNFLLIKKSLLHMLTNFGRPHIAVVDANYDNSQELCLKHYYDGLGLDPQYAWETLRNIYKFWQRPVSIETVVVKDDKERPVRLGFNGKENTTTRIK